MFSYHSRISSHLLKKDKTIKMFPSGRTFPIRISLPKAKFTFGDSHGFPFRETLYEAKSILLINFLLPTLPPGHLQRMHEIFLVYSALADVNWQDNRCDSKSDVTAVLSGGLICQWNTTFRFNTCEHTWQPPLLPLNSSWCFPASQDRHGVPTCTLRFKFQYFLYSRAGISNNFRAEFPHRGFEKCSFRIMLVFPCSLLHIRQSTKADVAQHSYRLMCIYTVS